MQESIIIIGAGIAGLSPGCYGQMNGYRTQIFELHDKPGGLCTSWKRKGYTFDGCIHWLVGSGPGSSFHRVWEELGAVQGRRMVNHEEFERVEGTGGKALVIYTDVDQLEQHMQELSPADAGVIKEFAGAVRLFTRFEPPLGKPRELMGPLDGRSLPELIAQHGPHAQSGVDRLADDAGGEGAGRDDDAGDGADQVACRQHQPIGAEPDHCPHAHRPRVPEADQHALVEATVGNDPRPEGHNHQAQASRFDDLRRRADDPDDDTAVVPPPAHPRRRARHSGRPAPQKKACPPRS